MARKALEIDETLGEAHALHSILIDAVGLERSTEGRPIGDQH